MKLAYWMYMGPAHIGTLRIASSFKNVHAIMHAPLGDDYFNVMRSMLERQRTFTPVTASVVDRHVLARGSQEKVINNLSRKDKQENPDLLILTPTCTSSILQEDLQNFVDRASLEAKADVLLADVNHYRVNEFEAADRTLLQIVEYYLSKPNSPDSQTKTVKPSVNIIGNLTLGFHNQHDIVELKKLFLDLDIDINLIIPEGTSVKELSLLPKAWFNFVPYRETGLLTAEYLKNKFGMPFIELAPMGIIQTAEFIRQIQSIINNTSQNNVNFDAYIENQTRFVSNSAWFARSIDCQNLTGKTAVVFGDATHAAAMTRILSKEMGIKVCWAGTYCKNDAAWFNEQTMSLCDEVIITDDYDLIENMINKVQPEAIFGTQMERHIGKRLNIPCGVISSPIHVQNFPLSYRPFLGYEGSNQITDLIYNTFTLGMEDHLLEVFGGHDNTLDLSKPSLDMISKNLVWSKDAIIELNKIPGFVREKVRKNTENFALKNKKSEISVELMYQAKEMANT